MWLEAIVGGFSFLILSYIIYFKRPRNYPPGPWRLPILGNLLSLGPAPFRTFIEWKKIYGPVVAADFGSFPAVAVSDYKLIRECLMNPASLGRPDLQPFLDRSGGIRRGILFSDGEEWVEQRRFTVRHLKEFGFGQKHSSGRHQTTEAIILSEVAEWLNDFEKDAGKPTSFKLRFHSAVLNVLWTVMAGERLRQDDAGVAKLMLQITENVETYNGQSALAMFLPWFTKWFPRFSGYDAMMADLIPALDFLQSYINKHKETNIPNDPRDLIDAYLDKIRATEDPRSSFFGNTGEKSLATVILDMFFAGTDSTSLTLNWLFLYLARYPKAQEKLLAEIDAIVGERTPTLADRDHMPYTEAVLQETFRLSSIAPIGIFHSTLDRMEIGGYVIPKKTMLILNLVAAHQDEDYWGDPEIFRPERFLSSDGTSLIKHEPMLAFSLGKRACLGERLARDELFLFTTSIFQHYRVIPPPENPVPSLEPVVSFLLGVKNQKLILEKRV